MQRFVPAVWQELGIVEVKDALSERFHSEARSAWQQQTEEWRRERAAGARNDSVASPQAASGARGWRSRSWGMRSGEAALEQVASVSQVGGP